MKEVIIFQKHIVMKKTDKHSYIKLNQKRKASATQLLTMYQLMKRFPFPLNRGVFVTHDWSVIDCIT